MKEIVAARKNFRPVGVAEPRDQSNQLPQTRKSINRPEIRPHAGIRLPFSRDRLAQKRSRPAARLPLNLGRIDTRDYLRAARKSGKQRASRVSATPMPPSPLFPIDHPAG